MNTGFIRWTAEGSTCPHESTKIGGYVRVHKEGAWNPVGQNKDEKDQEDEEAKKN